MRQHQLVIFRTEARHHETEHHEEGSGPDDCGEVASIVRGSDQNGHSYEQERLKGPNPTDLAWVLVTKQIRFVERLEDPKSVRQAPGILLSAQ